MRSVRAALTVLGAQQQRRVPALKLRAQGPQRSPENQRSAAAADGVLYRLSNKRAGDPEVCISALDPHCRQPGRGRQLQGSLHSTLSRLEPSGWPSHVCGARQLGAGHNLVFHAKVLSGDPVPAVYCSQIRLLAVPPDHGVHACASMNFLPSLVGNYPTTAPHTHSRR